MNNVEADRQRDLFPLPPLGGSLRTGTGGRKSRRRVLKRGYVSDIVDDAIDALNSLEGHARQLPSNARGATLEVEHKPPSAAQKTVHASLISRGAGLGPCPSDLTPSGAFCELRGASPYEEPECKVASFAFADLSLPVQGSMPVPLAHAFGRAVETLCKASCMSNYSMALRHRKGCPRSGCRSLMWIRRCSRSLRSTLAF